MKANLFFLTVFIVIIFLANSSQLSAQVDTLQVEQDTSLQSKVFIPVPRRSGFLSLALPGSGQIYNRKYWKLPFVYGALGASIGFHIYSKDKKNEWGTYYEAIVEQDTALINTFPIYIQNNQNNSETIKNRRDLWDKRFQLSLFAIGAVWALQAVEAYVDAHLQNFDIEEDLTIKLFSKPKIPRRDHLDIYNASPHQFGLICITYSLH